MKRRSLFLDGRKFGDYVVLAGEHKRRQNNILHHIQCVCGKEGWATHQELDESKSKTISCVV